MTVSEDVLGSDLHFTVRQSIVTFCLLTSSIQLTLIGKREIPQNDFAVHAARGKIAHGRDRKHIHDVVRVQALRSLELLLQVQIVDMNVALDARCDDFVVGLARPSDRELDLGDGLRRFELVVDLGVPEADRVV